MMIDEIDARKRICPWYKQGMLANPKFAYTELSATDPLMDTINKWAKCDGSDCFEWEICFAYQRTGIKKLHAEGICTLGYPGCMDDCDGHICAKLLDGEPKK